MPHVQRPHSRYDQFHFELDYENVQFPRFSSCYTDRSIKSIYLMQCNNLVSWICTSTLFHSHNANKSSFNAIPNFTFGVKWVYPTIRQFETWKKNSTFIQISTFCLFFPIRRSSSKELEKHFLRRFSRIQLNVIFPIRHSSRFLISEFDTFTDTASTFWQYLHST